MELSETDRIILRKKMAGLYLRLQVICLNVGILIITILDILSHNYSPCAILFKFISFICILSMSLIIYSYFHY